MMRSRHLRALASALLLCSATSVAAQDGVPWPLQSTGYDPATGWDRLEVQTERLADLATRDALLMTIALPTGPRNFALRRLSVDDAQFGFQIDGLPADQILDDAELSVWIGGAPGAAGSDAVLGFSRYGAWGWVRTGDDHWHVVSRAGAGDDWLRADVLLTRDEGLEAFGVRPDFTCGALDVPGRHARQDPPPSTGPGGYTGGLLVCPVAIETDDAYFARFGDLGAAAAYTATLLTAVSSRFETQVGTKLIFPYVQFYTSGNSPWPILDDTVDMMNAFKAAWMGAIPGEARLGHFLSGLDLGGGYAYIGVLCNDEQTFSFAVSGNLTGSTPFPIAVGPMNWDFYVIAHELGHNFDAPHTHSTTPPIDLCGDENNQQCISNGTLMSYCHTCPGGIANITTFFQEPTITGIMQAHAQACLAPFVDEIWVDFAYAGPENGSAIQPFNTLAEALGAADAGDVVRIKSGATTEKPTIGQFVRITANAGAVTVGAP